MVYEAWFCLYLQLVQQEEELRREEEAAYEARRKQAEMAAIERPPVEGADDRCGVLNIINKTELFPQT